MSHTKNLSELYATAIKEMVNPIPSSRSGAFKDFDSFTGGFRPKEFSILCGSTGVGKTCLLANLSAGFIDNGIKHFVASVETGATDYIKRILSVWSCKDLNTGEAVNKEDLKIVTKENAHKIKGDMLRLSLYEDRFSVDELVKTLEFESLEHGCKIAIIDNLNFFLDVTAAEQSIVEMDRVIHKLIIFCKKVDMHIIMVMHPRKTDSTKVRSEFDIKGSSTAVQEAHNIFLLNKIGVDLKEFQKHVSAKLSENDRELMIAKMRRKGTAVGNRIFFNCTNGIKYTEKGVLRCK